MLLTKIGNIRLCQTINVMTKNRKFSGSIKRVGSSRNRFLVEGFKFSLCLFLPLGASMIYANPAVMHDLVRKYSFVKYPEADFFDGSPEDDVKKLAQQSKDKSNDMTTSKKS